jgi:hypothetical protein
MNGAAPTCTPWRDVGALQLLATGPPAHAGGVTAVRDTVLPSDSA